MTHSPSQPILVFGATGTVGREVVCAGRRRLHRALLRALYGLMMPPYCPKMRLAECIRRSLLRPVVLIPGNDLQNETLFLSDMAAGTYPLPLAGVGRVDTRDIGDAAARALLDPHVPGGAYDLTTPDSLSGKDAAAEWSAALGRPVSYEPDLKRAVEVFGREVGGQKAVSPGRPPCSPGSAPLCRPRRPPRPRSCWAAQPGHIRPTSATWSRLPRQCGQARTPPTSVSASIAHVGASAILPARLSYSSRTRS